MIGRYPPRPRGDEPASLHSQPGASHHQRHCKICSHPDRADIEADFTEWAHPEDIAREYNISRASIYRHARAAGLFDRRNSNLRFALGRLIERVGHIRPTADCIVRAIHAFARINDEGQWIEPPAHVIVSSGGVRREAAVRPSRRPIAIQLDSPATANAPDPPASRATPEPAVNPPCEAQVSSLPAVAIDDNEARESTGLPAAHTDPLFATNECAGHAGVLPETVNRVETNATY